MKKKTQTTLVMFRTPKPLPKGRDLVFQIIDAYTEDYQPGTNRPPAKKRQKTDDDNNNISVTNDTAELVIRLFGVTYRGTSVSVRLHEFYPSFYLALPKEASQLDADGIASQIRNMVYPTFKSGCNLLKSLHKYDSSLERTAYVFRKPLFGFTNNEFRPYLWFQFRNLTAMKRCVGLLRFCLDPDAVTKAELGPRKYPVSQSKRRLHAFFQSLYTNTVCKDLEYRFIYEANVEPILRFFHRTKTTPCGWVRIPAGTYVECPDDANCQWNLTTSFQTVQPVLNPSIAPLIQASFDIECISEDGGFPVPERDADQVIQIATTFQRYGEDSCFYKHIICLGPCDRETLDADVDLEVYYQESDVLLAWQRLLRKIDPDILYGYNIFGFDLRYLMVRAEKLDVLKEFSLLGRVKDKPSKLKNKSTVTKQHGFNDWYMVHMPGIVQIDLLPVMRTEHKFPRYTLQYVSETVLGEHKLDVKPKEIFAFYQSGDPKQVAKVANYCVQDTLLPQRLVNKLKKLTNLIERARVSCVPLSWLITRGQQIQVFSLLARTAELNQFVIPTIDRYRRQNQDNDVISEKRTTKGYQGATVLSAKRGAYFDPVTGLDFKSLYPTIMIDWNLCYTTLVENEAKYGNIPGMTYKTIRVGNNEYKFAQKQKGLLPKILIHLLESRGVAKRDMFKAKTALERDIANGRQLAFKVTCNSVYGFCGAEAGGFMPCKAIAASVTSIGRGMIDDSKRFAENIKHFSDLDPYKFRLHSDPEKYQLCSYGAEVVYGDSVTGDTPILIRWERDESSAKYIAIQDLCWIWRPRSEDNKQLGVGDPWEVWTEQGWTPIKKVIRHRCRKKIYRIQTPTGVVDVTEDHSLLRANGHVARPQELVIGDHLLHTNLPRYHKAIPYNIHDILRHLTYGKDNLASYNFVVDSKLKAAQLYHLFSANGFYPIISDFTDDDIRMVVTNRFTGKPHRYEQIQSIKELDQLSSPVYVYDLETKNHHFAAGVGRLVVHNTDSIYTKFDTSMLEHSVDKIAYSMEIGRIVSKRITDFLRSQNPFRKAKDKWTELEYEKVYKPLFLFSKKRYAGYMYENNPAKPTELDKKGIVLKRRDNCPFLKEVYGGCIKILFDDTMGNPKDRIEAARSFAHQKVDDLLSGKVPIESLIITQKLNHSYKSRTLGEEISLQNLLDQTCYRCNCEQKPQCMFKNKPCEFCTRVKRNIFTGSETVQHIPEDELYPDITKAQVRVAAKRTQRSRGGDKPASNDRVPYVFCINNDRKLLARKDLLQCDLAEDPTYAQEHGLKLHYKYYLEKQLEKPLISLFEILIDDAEHMFDRQKKGTQDITRWLKQL